MKLVLGVDEAGRGPLAGPVAVGVVCAPESFDFLSTFPGLNDSKQLTEGKREELFALLESCAEVSWHVELVSHRIIDSRGIVHAVRRGMRVGVRKLCPDPAAGKLWLDGALKVPRGYDGEVIIHGDGLIPAIMLASVAAKVVRDRYMVKLAKRYRRYGFDAHKGYGTDAHYAALREHGPCVHHRQTFLHLDRRQVELYTPA